MKYKAMFGMTGLSMVLIGLLAAGCVSHSREVVVREQVPSSTTVIETPTPPPPQVENPGPAPYSGAVWVPGFWEKRSGEWTWIGGHWEHPTP